MNRESRDFLRATTALLDKQLTALTAEQQHDLLDALAAEIEERMVTLVESDAEVECQPW
jgi:hypothetical protein